MKTAPSQKRTRETRVTRRQFAAGASVSVLGATLLRPGLALAAEANSKIDIGLIGCGGRGKWIADLFLKDGRYPSIADPTLLLIMYMVRHNFEDLATYDLGIFKAYGGYGWDKLMAQIEHARKTILSF